MISRLSLVFGCLIVLAITVYAGSSKKIETVEDLSRDAYVWGYPAVYLSKVRDTMLANTKEGSSAINHFYHAGKVPDPFLGPLINVNPENLYSWAWVDLRKEPLVMTHPLIKDRYFAVHFVDAYSSVFHALSELSFGENDGNFIITGPQWKESLPEGLIQIRADTPEILIIAQTFVSNSKEIAKVTKLAGQRQLIPLSLWQKGVRTDSFKGVYPKSPLKVNKNIAADGTRFYEDLRKVVETNPPPTQASQKELERFKPLGLQNKSALQVSLETEPSRKMIERGIFEGEREIQQRLASGFGSKINGWSYELKAPPFTDDYLLRAAVSQRYFFSPPSSESMQIVLDTDSEGRQLTGSYRYVLHFEKEDLPPARSMWTLRAHDMKNSNLESPAHTISFLNSKSTQLKYNMDGSLDLLVQEESPEKIFRSNWLPIASNVNFQVVMTLYNPRNSVLNRKYIAPSIIRIDDSGIPKQRVTHTMMADLETPVSK